MFLLWRQAVALAPLQGLAALRGPTL